MSTCPKLNPGDIVILTGSLSKGFGIDLMYIFQLLEQINNITTELQLP